jgi:hypothetical protein
MTTLSAALALIADPAPRPAMTRASPCRTAPTRQQCAGTTWAPSSTSWDRAYAVLDALDLDDDYLDSPRRAGRGSSMTSLETTSGGRPYWRYDWRALDGRSDDR